MRPLGLTLVALFAAPSAWAQVPPGPPPAAPAVPAAQPPAGPANAVLDTHLAGWERAMHGTVNFRSDFKLTRTDNVFKRNQNYTGIVLCMKPNLARLRINAVANPPNQDDYEAYICTGQFVYEYNGLAKTITEMPIGGAGNSDNLMLDFLSGMTAQAVKARFQISLFKQDEHYVYLDIKPVLGKDKQSFEQVRFALFGPGVQAPFTPYMPAQVWMKKPNGDEETWQFSNPTTNVTGVTAAMFQRVDVPNFQFKRVPAPGAPGPAPQPKR